MNKKLYNLTSNFKFKFLLLLLSFFISFQISALIDMDSKIICKNVLEDIVFKREHVTTIMMTNEDNESNGLSIIKVDEDYIIAEEAKMILKRGARKMGMITYVFLINESNDITRVKSRTFTNPELLGFDNIDLRISISLEDSSYLASCLKS